MKRYDIINHLIKHNGYTRYLEIGYNDGHCFNQIEVENKISIDPDPNTTPSILIDSDSFFKQNTEEWDIIFVDGLHHSDQVYKDIKNSLNCLSKGGAIVVHDCLPESKEMQEVPRNTKVWTGDCWKAWVQLRAELTDYSMRVIDTDYGVGIIQQGENKPIKPTTQYEIFSKTPKYYLNLYSWQEYLELI